MKQIQKSGYVTHVSILEMPGNVYISPKNASGGLDLLQVWNLFWWETKDKSVNSS